MNEPLEPDSREALIAELFQRMKTGDETWPELLRYHPAYEANCIFAAVLTRFGQWMTHGRTCMNANGRLCRRFKVGFKHIAKIGRPVYKATSNLSVAASIARERAAAARAAAMKGKKKK